MNKRTGSGFFRILTLIGRPFYYSLLFLVYGFLAVFKLWGLGKKKLLSVGKKIKIRRLTLPAFSLPKRTIPQKRPKKQKKVKPGYFISFPFKSTAFLLGAVVSLLLTGYLLLTFLKDLPSPASLTQYNGGLTTKIFDRNGSLLYKIYREKNRTPVALEELPDHVIKATVSIEDKNFFNHRGLSAEGILRATYKNIVEGKKSGGSTITQQLIKNVLLTPEKTFKRKVREAVLAIVIERKYTKNQILEMYLNSVGYGGSAYGIEEAAQKYFGKSGSELSLAEAALLAGLPASPTRYSPFGAHPELAKERELLVLARMVEDGYISELESKKAGEKELEFVPQETSITAPHFVMYVKDLLAEKYGEKLVEEGGLEIKTSLDIGIQEKVQQIVSGEVKKLGNLHITNGAALVTNPKTGEILAMVGSKDYFAKDIDGNYNVTTALRQPGSSIKPVNYSIALENGFTPGSLIEDSPITYMVPGQPPYSPRNYDNRFHGKVPLRTALGSSYNVPAVKVLAAFGVKKMIERGQEMGITSWVDSSRYGLSLTLGGGEIKMTDLATVYGVLANNGIRVDLNPILQVKDSRGQILEQKSHGQETPVLSPGVSFLLTSILSDNTARTPAFGPNSILNIPGRTVAVKTGTTQNLRDNWTIGYTPSLLAAVWVGNNNNTPMSYVASGVTGASPIWRKIMDSLLKNQPAEYFPKPEDIKEVTICSTTGTLPCDGCPIIRNEFFIAGTEPKIACNPEGFKEVSPTPIP